MDQALIQLGIPSNFTQTFSAANRKATESLQSVPMTFTFDSGFGHSFQSILNTLKTIQNHFEPPAPIAPRKRGKHSKSTNTFVADRTHQPEPDRPVTVEVNPQPRAESVLPAQPVPAASEAPVVRKPRPPATTHNLTAEQIDEWIKGPLPPDADKESLDLERRTEELSKKLDADYHAGSISIESIEDMNELLGKS
jgi:hypothetical protein